MDRKNALVIVSASLVIVVAVIWSPALRTYMQGNVITADLVVKNAVIYTSDPSHPWAEAMAFRNNRILAIGDFSSMQEFVGQRTQSKDLHGKMVVPGFIDSHVHFISGGLQMAQVDLHDVQSKVEFIMKVEQAVNDMEKGDWVLGGGWNNDRWGGELPQASWIDNITHDHPVWLSRMDGHMGLANSLALAKAGIHSESRDIVGGAIIKSNDGAPTGLLVDAAMDLLLPHIPEATVQKRRDAMMRASKLGLSRGVTTVVDFGRYFPGTSTRHVWDDFSEVYKWADETGHMLLRADSESHCFQIQATLYCTLSKNNTSEDRNPEQTPNAASENPFSRRVRSASDLLRKCQRWDHQTEAKLYELGFPLTYEFIRRVLISLHEDATMALRFFVWTEQWYEQTHCPPLYQAMVEILVKENNFEELLREMLENPNLFNTAVMLLVECYVFMRCPVKAFEELKCIKNSGFNRPSQIPYNILFTSLVREGFLAEAKEICTEMLVVGMKPSVFSLDSLLIALCDHREAEDAAIMLENMEIQGFFPSSTCCAVLIRELCRGMQGDRAYCIVSDILKSKSRKTRSLNICVYAFCKAGQLEKAEMLIEESIDWGYVLDIVTYNSLIAGFCWAGRVEESRLILDRIMEAGCVPDVISYNTMIAGYNRKVMLSHSLNIFEEMMQNGIPPNVCTYNSMIHGFSKAGKLEEANKLLQDMMSRDLVPCVVTCNIILDGLCKSGKASDALTLFRKLNGLHFSPKIETYNILIDGLCKAGKLDDSHRILKEAGELGYVPTLVTYTTVMKCCFRSGKLEQGLMVFSEMKNKGYAYDAFTCCTVIGGLSKLGKFQEACACIGHMLIRGIVFDLVTYNSILNTFCKAGELERAFHLLYDMESRGWISDVYTNTILIDGICRTGDMDTAYRHFTAMIRKGCLPNLVTYNALIAGFCKVGKVDIAIDLFKMMQEKDRITYTSLLHGLCKAGRVLNAYSLLLSCLENRINVCDSAVGAVHAALCNSRYFREVQKLKSIIQMTKILQE